MFYTTKQYSALLDRYYHKWRIQESYKLMYKAIYHFTGTSPQPELRHLMVCMLAYMPTKDAINHIVSDSEFSYDVKDFVVSLIMKQLGHRHWYVIGTKNNLGCLVVTFKFEMLYEFTVSDTKVFAFISPQSAVCLTNHSHRHNYEFEYISDNLVMTNPMLGSVFKNCHIFNCRIGGWDVSTVMDMSRMFEGAGAFNHSLNNWDVSNVLFMHYMFHKASSFNRDLNGWDVSSVTLMAYMFQGATMFNGNISSWVTSSVTCMDQMFSGATSFNGDIHAWNTVRVKSMYRMFENAFSFNQDLNGWNVTNVTSMDQMFSGATSFNGDIHAWNTVRVKSMYRMFENATSFDIPNHANWYRTKSRRA